MSAMPSSDKLAMVVVIESAGSLDAKTTANAAAKKMVWTVRSADHSAVRRGKAGVFAFSGVVT